MMGVSNGSFRQVWDWTRLSAGSLLAMRKGFLFTFLVSWGLFVAFSGFGAPSDSLISFPHEVVRLTHGNTQLIGTLWKPKATARFPVVIFIHGDGPRDRSFSGYYDSIFQAFLQIGVGCLSWDKPGVGQSTSPYGPYQRDKPQSFYQRAGELRKALDYLKARADVDSTQIGCWGISQAGWIIPMVAAQSPDIRFIIAVTCPAQSAIIQSEYATRLRLRASGVPADSVNQLLAQDRKANEQLPNPTPSSAFWRFLGGNETAWPEQYARQADDDGSFLIDPFSYLQTIRCPVLAIFAQHDQNVDPGVSAALYRKALQGNKDVLIKTFADADHLVFRSATGLDREWRRHLDHKEYPYASGYILLQVNWLKKHIQSKR